MNISNLRAFGTKNKFCLCFGILDEEVREMPETFYSEKGIDIEAFRKLLNQYGMDEYFGLLLAIFWSQDIFKTHFEELENYIQKEKEHLITLTEALIMLLTEIKGPNPTLRLQTSKVLVIIPNKNIIESIINGLIEDFKKEDFDLNHLTIEEAIEEIKIKKDQDWINQWIKEQSLIDSIFPMPTEKDLVAKKQQMTKDYSASHFIKREITLEYLKTLYKKLIITKPAGAPTKNLYLVIEVKYLSYLKRINRFLDQDEIEDIEKCHIEDEDLRFIHECLVFFKRIDVKSSKELNTSTPEKYFRTILHQTKHKSWDSSFRVICENINDLRTLKYSIVS